MKCGQQLQSRTFRPCLPTGLLDLLPLGPLAAAAAAAAAGGDGSGELPEGPEGSGEAAVRRCIEGLGMEGRAALEEVGGGVGRQKKRLARWLTIF